MNNIETAIACFWQYSQNDRGQVRFWWFRWLHSQRQYLLHIIIIIHLLQLLITF